MNLACLCIDSEPSAQSKQRGDKVIWNEDNPHYQEPPEGWPPTNVDMVTDKSPASFLGKLWRATFRKWFLVPTEMGRVQYPIGTLPEYTVDITQDQRVVDVVFGYSVYGGGPSQEVPTFGGTFEISGSLNGLWGSGASVSPYSINYGTSINPSIVRGTELNILLNSFIYDPDD